MKIIRLICVLSLACEVAAARNTSAQWNEDSRVTNLASCSVGELPPGPLNCPTLLALYNKRVIENGAPANCRVVLLVAPDTLLSSNLWNDVKSIDARTKQNMAKIMRMHGGGAIEDVIQNMTLRQFLWFVCSVYCLRVMYEPAYIAVGTEFFSHDYIEPGGCAGASASSGLPADEDVFIVPVGSSPKQHDSQKK